MHRASCTELHNPAVDDIDIISNITPLFIMQHLIRVSFILHPSPSIPQCACSRAVLRGSLGISRRRNNMNTTDLISNIDCGLWILAHEMFFPVGLLFLSSKLNIVSAKIAFICAFNDFDKHQRKGTLFLYHLYETRSLVLCTLNRTCISAVFQSQMKELNYQFNDPPIGELFLRRRSIVSAETTYCS